MNTWMFCSTQQDTSTDLHCILKAAYFWETSLNIRLLTAGTLLPTHLASKAG